MSALTESLFEAEFYGHSKGAFTGATYDRKGYLETTSGGTLFLDEIGSLPLLLQGKLLRVLQEGEYFKLGTSRPRGADVRFIAATNADLDTLQSKGIFRKDLFYRLCGAWLHLPPLRERKEDLVVLVDKFFQDHLNRSDKITLEEPVWTLLNAYEYPGNIRELKSIIQYAANLAQDQPITIHHLPPYFVAAVSKLPSPARRTTDDIIVPLAITEKEQIIRAYRITGGNKLQTARSLAINPNTLRHKLRSYGIE
jgi:transcriptional regulator with PAS, ATPase and Fis domain